MGLCEAENSPGSQTSPYYFTGIQSEKDSLHRTPSVDDLFAPLWRLEVQHQTLAPEPQVFQDSKRMSRSVSPIQIQSRNEVNPSRSQRTPEIPSTSASDEDPLALIDDKKQKRMLSNRESARRSRLRKQQHLEELRSQLLDLRAQNSHILGKLTLASQQFTQLNHDNNLLRLHAMELSRKLQHLHQQATLLHPDGLQAFGFGNSHLDPPGVALGSCTSAYSLVSDVLQGNLCS